MRISLYLPDELGRRVKELQLPIAAICQPALRAAVQLAEATMYDEQYQLLVR